MGDKQFSAFLLFFMVAFALYLNNSPSSSGGSSKLSDIIGLLTGKNAESAPPYDLTGTLKKNRFPQSMVAPGGVGPVLLPTIAAPPSFTNPGGNWLNTSPGFFSDWLRAGGAF